MRQTVEAATGSSRVNAIRTAQIGLIAMAVTIGVGCRTGSADRQSVARLPAPAQVAPPANDSAREETGPKPSTIRLASAETFSEENGPPPVEASEPTSVTLVEAIERALAQNPDLVAQRQADPVAVATLGVAQTYPFNPFFQSTVTPWQDSPSGGPGSTYHYLLLMQTIQLAHQQQFREDGACAALNTVRWNVRQAELLNVAQTSRLFFAALYQRGLRDIARAAHENNEQLLRILEKQVNAGEATAADAAIVRVDAQSTRQQAQLAEANYQTALRDLRRQMNISPLSTVEPTGELTSHKWQPATPESLLAESGISYAALTGAGDTAVALAASRPDVLALRSEIDVGRAGLNLASASKTPDLQIGPYYQRTDDGTTFLGLRAHFDIPVINSGAPLERQRHAEYHQRIMAWQQLQTRAELEAQAALERYAVAYELAAPNESPDTDSFPAELQRLEEQFRAGEVDVVRMIQARLSTIQNRRARLDLLNELAQSAANLTAAAGVMPDRLVR
jgi:outer membrane protein, heavy metal efflux system